MKMIIVCGMTPLTLLENGNFTPSSYENVTVDMDSGQNTYLIAIFMGVQSCR
jgi:hypothetical protein